MLERRNSGLGEGLGLPSPKAKVDNTPAEQTPLWKCLQEDDIAGVERLVKQMHCNVNIQDSTFGWTPMHFVCNTGNAKLMKLFLEAKAKVGIGDTHGNTPLMLACRRGHQRCAELLAARQVQLDVQNHNGWTALMWSSIHGHEDVATALMGARGSFLVTDKEGRSACMWAARHGHLGIVEAILSCGINLDVQDHAGLTIMDHAQEHEKMRSMIAAVAELNAMLLDAVKRGDSDEACALLQAGANVELRDEDGWTPLMWAVMGNSVDLVELMIRHGANPSLLDSQGEGLENPSVGEALHTILGSNDKMLTAAKANDWDEVDEQLRLGAFVNMKDESNRTALMWAGRNAATEALSTLVSKNALVDERDIFGWAAVHYAVESHDLEAVSMLWYLGADFSLKTSEDDTLLHIAVRGDDGPMIQLLLAAQAQLEEPNVESHTPLMVATTNSLTQSIHTLVAYKASIAATDDLKRTPFALAVMRGQMKAVAAMLDLKYPPKVVMGADCSSKVASKTKPGRASRSASSKKSAAPVSPSSEAKQAQRKALAQAASGVAKRKKLVPIAAAEKRGDNPKALLETATEKRAEVGSKKPASVTKALLKQVDCDGRMPLTLSVVTSNMQIFHRLLEESADPSVSSAAGNTVLAEAVIAKEHEAVTKLLELGVQAETVNKQGKKPKDLCEDDIIRQMLDRYAIISKLPDSPDPVDDGENDESRPSTAGPCFRVRMEQLPTDITDDVLMDGIRLFLKQRGAAAIMRINVVLDPITDRPRGHAYLDFADAASADLALRGDGLKMSGHAVRMVRDPTGGN